MKIHIARTGETLWDIAQKYNIPLQRLQEFNPDLTESDELKAGEKVRVPTGKIPLAVSKQEREKEDESKDEKKIQEDCPEYPQTHTRKESHKTGEFLAGDLPKPPSVDELTEWSQTMMDESSSWMENSSFYENHGNTTYMSAPFSYPYYCQGFAPVPPAPLPQEPFYLSGGWSFQPYYPPPGPMIQPNEYPNHLEMKYREWKESSSSEG